MVQTMPIYCQHNNDSSSAVLVTLVCDLNSSDFVLMKSGKNRLQVYKLVIERTPKDESDQRAGKRHLEEYRYEPESQS